MYVCTTGIYPSSHQAILSYIKTFFTEKHKDIDYEFFRGGLKKIEGGGAVQQVKLKEREIMVVIGSMAHSTMYAQVPMENNVPRIIQNPKVSRKRLKAVRDGWR